MIIINSKENKVYKLISNLLKNKKKRDKEKMFVVEGLKNFNEISKDFCFKFIVVSESFYKKSDTIISKIKKKWLRIDFKHNV